jgi:hypothetical protein
LQLFIFSGYFIHVIDDVVFSSAKTHLPTDNQIMAVRLPRTFLKPSRASGQPISESLQKKELQTKLGQQPWCYQLPFYVKLQHVLIEWPQWQVSNSQRTVIRKIGLSLVVVDSAANFVAWKISLNVSSFFSNLDFIALASIMKMLAAN